MIKINYSSINSKIKITGRLKIYVTGPYNTGKTTLVHQLDPYAVSIERKRPNGTTTTVGFDHGIIFWLVDKKNEEKQFLLNRIEIKQMSEKERKKYNIYEVILLGTPGQMQFAPVREILAKGSQGVLFVMDSTNVGQIGVALAMLEETKAYLGHYIPMVILANKQDLNGALKGDEILKLLKIKDIKIYETSAIRNVNIKEALIALLNEIVKCKKSYKFSEITRFNIGGFRL